MTHATRPARITFSPNGWLLAVAGGELVTPGEVRIWDGTPMEEGD